MWRERSLCHPSASLLLVKLYNRPVFQTGIILIVRFLFLSVYFVFENSNHMECLEVLVKIVSSSLDTLSGGDAEKNDLL